jgi:energy-converting hydrogenase B subunit Q
MAYFLDVRRCWLPGTKKSPGYRRKLRRGYTLRSMSESTEREVPLALMVQTPVAGEAADVLIGDLHALPVVRAAERAPSFQKVYGKRIIVVGGGAQVGQVVVGAVAEADRHNIRGEKISVDTIPLVGEEELAAATRAVARLPRAVALVLAGALMGGEVTSAVHEIREKGIIVLSLNMPGSVPDAADLVVSDPVQCGVMAVMAVSDSALFDITRQRGKRY